MSTLNAPGNTPLLAEVRDKIEGRYAKVLSGAGLTSNSVGGRMLEVQRSTVELAGADRRSQMLASLGEHQLAGAPPAPASLGHGTRSDVTEAQPADSQARTCGTGTPRHPLDDDGATPAGVAPS